MKFNIPEFTVSEFSRSIKRVVEDAFGYVKIKGEISGFKKATSGHLYFTLKDENSTISAVCFRNMAQLVDFEIVDGLQVVASGKITTFEGRSSYQIIVEKIEISGIGAILEMIEKRRQKLVKEGIFDEIHKKQLPFFPKKIAVITSETGAVIEDIKHRISARCPLHLVVYSSVMQGNKAASEVIFGIKYFNKLKKENRPDVIIIARGGGSFEDLLPFSDELLVREVFKSEIPIISAIGHETDISLIDYVADLRAPTPTAAAELVTPVFLDLKNKLNYFSEKLEFLPKNILENNKKNLLNIAKYLINPKEIFDKINKNFISLKERINFLTKIAFEKKEQKLFSIDISTNFIKQKITTESQKSDFIFQNLNSIIKNNINSEKNKLDNLVKLLKSQHYDEILKKGFSLIKNKKGDLIYSTSNMIDNKEISVEMSDGKVEIIVDKYIKK